MNLARIAGLAAIIGMGGCHHAKKTDEQLLRERIDTTSVQLYVATKLAVTKADTSPEFAEARGELLAAIEGFRKDEAAPAAVDAGAPIGAHDFAALAVALWKLRGQAQGVVASGREDGLAPVVPVLLRGSTAPPEMVGRLDLGTEHALFLAAMLATRMSPREPVHVPDELLLYEAWMTRAGSTKLDGFAAAVEAMAAIAFGTGQLCDLAAAASTRADAAAGDAGAAMAATVSALSAGKASLTAEQTAAIDLATRGVAHGLTGSCYLGRHQAREATTEIQRLVSAAEALGAERKEIEAQLARLGDDPEKTKAYLADLMFGTIKDRLQRTGALDALADLEVARALRGYVRAATGALEGAKRKFEP